MRKILREKSSFFEIVEPVHKTILERLIFANFLQFVLVKLNDFVVVEASNGFSYIEETDPHQCKHLKIE